MASNNQLPTSSGPALFPGLPAPPTEEAEHPRHGIRETVETVVFVTVLVLLLKSFVAEAFVIPTGSMAETLLGYRRFETCPSCGEEFPVNYSEQVDPQRGNPEEVLACTCPNCRYHDTWNPGDHRNDWGSGDRVLVAKWPFQKFHRWDVVVFKYPEGPQKGWVPMNYIKRLVGLPGETIAILNGDLYSCQDVKYDGDQPPSELDRWQRRYMYMYPDPERGFGNAPGEAARDAFLMGRFKILRKPPAQKLSMRRIVFDNDKQPEKVPNVPNLRTTWSNESHGEVFIDNMVTPRWLPEAGWTANAGIDFTHDANAAGDSRLHYQHLIIPKGGNGNDQPELIKNFMGYNYGDPGPGAGKAQEDHFWVGDLMVECQVEVHAPAGKFTMELSKGTNRYEAIFDLASGECTLVRDGPVGKKELSKQPTALKGTGKHFVRFANFDEELTVWVDDQMPFGDGCECDQADRSGVPTDNDRHPASLAASSGAGLTARHIKLYRDTYYTGRGERQKAAGEPDLTMFIQPGHYLCMGDNSTQSSDGREWGAVPERLMQGKALIIYFPFWPLAPRFGPIR